MAHDTKHDALRIELARRAGAQAALVAAPLSGSACVCPFAAIALQFTADGGWRALQHAGNGANTNTLLAQAGNGDAIFGLELDVRAATGGWHLRTLCDRRCCTSGLNPPILSPARRKLSSSATAMK